MIYFEKTKYINFTIKIKQNIVLFHEKHTN